ncbi:MAG: GEVED domain-containing protein, partial [Planctomycetota bacterium]|nr:GEVED domain-containing protein [Planctomycetota bacterium]
TYRYDSTSHTIILTPTAGLWPDNRVYVVKLNNRDRFVINVPLAEQVHDGDQFQITDDPGNQVKFEFDSGFILHVPTTLSLQVPAAGASPTGVTEGQRFVVGNGAAPGVTFEMVLNGGTPQSGNIPIPFGPADTQVQIANAIVKALNGTLAQQKGLNLKAKLIDGQPGLVHLGAPTAYTLDSALASFSVSVKTLGLAIDSVGMGVGGVQDGQTFQVSDGSRTVRFEFDMDGLVTLGNQAVDLRFATTLDNIADAMVFALQTSGLDLLGTSNLGAGLVSLGAQLGATVNTAGSGTSLRSLYVSNPVRNTETFTVQFDHDGNPATATVDQTFQFIDLDIDSGGTTVLPPGVIGISFSVADTNDEVAAKVAAAVKSAAGLISLPKAAAIGDGSVYLGGTVFHRLLTPATGRLTQTGQPDVSTSTTLHVSGPLRLVIPAAGGAAIRDTDTFTVTDGVIRNGQPNVIFEWVDGTIMPNLPVLGHIPVPFLPTDDAAKIAQNVLEAFKLVTPAFKIDPTLPPNAAGNTLTPVILNGTEVALDATKTNGYHTLTVNNPSGSLVGMFGARVLDRENFTISDGSTAVTFEFDDNGVLTNAANKAILFNRLSSFDEISVAVTRAIAGATALQLQPQYLGGGAIRLFDTAQYVTNRTNAPHVTVTGIPGGAIAIPFVPSALPGYQDQLIQAMLGAINQSQNGLSGVSAALRGGNTIFVDFRDPATPPPYAPADFVNGHATVTGISNYFLRAIQDLPGNWLVANQASNETQFTILMPGTVLDYGDARATADRPSQYPTLLAEDGARHVLTANGPYLGDRVDGNADGQPVPAGVGDDLDHSVDLRDSALTIAMGRAPYSIQVPGTVTEGTTFSITNDSVSPAFTVTFEFDTNGSVTDDPLTPTLKGVHYTAGATPAQIAAAIVQAVANAGLGLQPADLGNGTVTIGGHQRQTLDAGTSSLSLEGLPVYLIRVDPTLLVQDGQTFTVSDGVYPVPTIFEFNNKGSVGVGHVPIPFLSTDNAAKIATAIGKAIAESRNILGQPLELTLTDLGDGALHVDGAPSHTLNFADSGLSYATHTPLVLTTPAAGLGFQLLPSLVIQVPRTAAGGVADGQTFTIGDPSHVVTFEFDNNKSLVNSRARSIAFQDFDSATTVADAIKAAILQATTVLPNQDPSLGLPGLNPTVDASSNAGFVLVDLGATTDYRLNTFAFASGLKQTEAVADGQSFAVSDSARTVTFVFDDLSDSISVTPSPTLQAVPFQPAYSANDLVNAMATAVSRAATSGYLNANVTAQSLGIARLQVSNVTKLVATVDVTLSPSLVIQVPKTTGGGVVDGATFTIGDPSHVVTFEFDSNNSLVHATARAIAFQPSDSAATVANAIQSAIQLAASLLPGLNPTQDATSNASFVLIDLGATTEYRLDTFASGLKQTEAVAAGQSFVLSDSAQTVTFVFDDLSDSISVTESSTLQAVPFQPTFSANDVVNAMAAAVSQAVTLGYLNANVTEQSMGGARLRVGNVTKVEATVDVTLPPSLVIQVPKTTGGGVVDGATFTIGDPSHVVTFEFDSNNSLVHATARAITFQPSDSAATVANAIRLAILQETAQLPGLNPTIDASSNPLFVLIDLGATTEYRLNTSTSGLKQTEAVAAGQSFAVSDSGQTVTFVFDDLSDSVSVMPSPTLQAIPFQPTFSANDVVNAMTAAVSQAVTFGYLNANVTAQSLGGARVRVGNVTKVDVVAPLDVLAPLDVMANLQATGAYALSIVHLPSSDRLARLALDGSDEDGVRLDGVLTPGVTVPLTITASTQGYLDGWIDFNSDGDWTDQYEQVFRSVSVQPGLNQLFVTVPANAGPGETFARFRISSQGGLQPTGLATDGEVEDYRLEIVSNDVPQLKVPSSLSTNSDIPLLLTGSNGIQVSDLDAGTGTMSLTLSVLHGRLLVNDAVPGGVIVGRIYNNDTGIVTLSGTLDQINATLLAPDGLTYQNLPPNYIGADLLTVLVDDFGNTGTGGPQHSFQTIPITVVAALDEVVGNTLTVTSIRVIDLDLAPDSPSLLTVTLSIPARTPMPNSQPTGTIQVTNVVGGVPTGAIVQISPTRIQLTGTLAELNLTLAAGVTYTVPDGDFNDNRNGGPVLLTVETNATPPRAPTITRETLTISVTPINDQPKVTPPSAPQQMDQNSTLTFLATNNPPNAIKIADVDANETVPDPQLQMELTAARGVLTLGSLNGLDFSSAWGGVGDGTADARMIFRGTLGSITVALDGLSFVPERNYFGSEASVVVKVDDRGYTGNDPAQPSQPSPGLVDTSTIAILVKSVPTLDPIGNETVLENVAGTQTVPYTVPLTGISGSAGRFSKVASVTAISLNPGLIPAPLISYDDNASVGVVSFIPAADKNTVTSGTAVIRVTVTSGVPDGSGGVIPGTLNLFSQDFTVTVTPVNGSPVRTAAAPAAINVNEDFTNATAVSLGLNGLSYLPGTPAATDEAAQTLKYKVISIPPAITVWLANGITPVAAGTTLLNAAALQGLKYKTVLDANGSGSLTWTVTDDASGLAPDVNTLTESLTITVNAVNDGPVRTAGTPVAISVNEDSANVTAVSLGLSGWAYAPGPATAVDEVGQTLTYRVTSVPPSITVWLADGTTKVTTGTTLDDLPALQGLKYKTVANANGTGNLIWTVIDSGNGVSPNVNLLTENLA